MSRSRGSVCLQTPSHHHLIQFLLLHSHSVRVSQGINHLRESLASTQWFLENTFHDYGWNQYEQCNGEEDEGQETSAYRERHSISSTERHEITSEASAMQALKKLQLEMVQVG